MSLNNYQYDSIMNNYNARRQAAEEAALQRANSILKQLPEYKKLDEELISLGMQLTRKLLSRDEIGAEELRKKMDEISAEKIRVLTGAGYPSDYLEVKYTCSDCKDKGFIGNERCQCFRKEISRLLYEQSNLKLVLKEDNFDNLSFEYFEGEDLERLKKAVSLCRDFVQNFSSDYQNLLFYGTVGTGKSFLSGCIAKELLDKDTDVVYFSSSQLFKTLSDIMFERGDRSILSSLRSSIYETSLLIIDDLGTEITNSAVASELFSLLNERHLERRATIISTNLDLRELQERYADRIFSRLLERYTILKLTGPDVRRIKRTGNSGLHS